MRSSLRLIFAFSLACTLAAAQAPSLVNPSGKAPAKYEDKPAEANLPTEATVDAFLQQTFGYDPKLNWKISSIKPVAGGMAEVNVILANGQGQQISRFYVTPDGEHAVVGDLMPFGARPYEPVKNILEKAITGPSRGPKDAAVTIIEFGDLQCPACKAAQPKIEELVMAEPKARFVFQNFPLEMHNWAAKGADYAYCVGEASNDAFWKFIAKTYETQGDITADNADAKLTALAEGAGLKGADIAACASTPVTKAHVEASIALGKSAGVTGTPTLFINGRVIGNVANVPSETLKNLVEFASKQGK